MSIRTDHVIMLQTSSEKQLCVPAGKVGEPNHILIQLLFQSHVCK